MNKVEHPFSIVAIKDTFDEFPHRFLLYYDERWECNFFFNFKTKEDHDEDNIRNRLANQLRVEPEKISLQFLEERVYSKYSVSAKEKKCYNHKLYLGKIEEFDDLMKQDSFEINGVQYKWMTIEAMERDPEIQKKNLDVVDMVKENIS